MKNKNLITTEYTEKTKTIFFSQDPPNCYMFLNPLLIRRYAEQCYASFRVFRVFRG